MDLISKITEFGNDVRMKPTKLYISWKRHTNFADIEVQKSKLKVTINVSSGMLNDPLHLAKDVKGIGHWGVGDYQLIVEAEPDVQAFLPLLRQSYERN